MRSKSYYENYADHFWKKVDRRGPDECWPFKMSPKAKRRYGSVTFMGKPIGSHQMAFRLFNGQTGEGFYVCHKCDNPRCCNPAHLFLGTNSDNQSDCSFKGRKPSIKGERNPVAKLTHGEVHEIRNLWKSGKFQQKQIAEQFKVSRASICLIVNHKHWNHDPT